MRILIAEDDVRLHKSLVYILELNKFSVDGVGPGGRYEVHIPKQLSMTSL